MSASTLPRDLRFHLWCLLGVSECLGRILGEALIEARLPGSMGDPEAVRILERFQAEEATLASFILGRLYPERAL